MSSAYTQKHTLSGDGTDIAYRVYPGKKESSIVVFVHGLFGSALLFHPIATILSKHQIRSISVDLRGFGASGQGKVTIEAFSDDLLAILTKEGLVKEFNGSYRCAKGILLVGYSMGTLVTSATKKRIAESDGGTRAMVEDIDTTDSKTSGDITLFHISPILAVKKRKLIRHFLLPGLDKLDLRILAHPVEFFHLVWEILSARRFIDLTGYIVSGFWDFCFFREMTDVETAPYTLRIFEKEDHYLLYHVPIALANYLLQAVFGIKESRLTRLSSKKTTKNTLKMA